MEQEVSKTPGETVGLFPGPLTEQSFKDLTRDQEQAAYEIWSQVPPKIACRISFWAEVTLQHIRSDGIGEPYWLAANGGRTEGGDERIDRALVTQDAKGIDDCVRTVIRRMSGLPGARAATKASS